MKKVITGVLAFILLLSMAACGAGPAVKDIAKIKEQIVTDLAIEGAMDIPTERLLDLYGIDAASVKTSACFITMGGAFPDEIVMVEAASESSAKEIAQKLENRLTDVTNQAQNYDAESFALFQKCKVQRSGVYVALFISAKAEQMQKLFDQ